MGNILKNSFGSVHLLVKKINSFSGISHFSDIYNVTLQRKHYNTGSTIIIIRQYNLHRHLLLPQGSDALIRCASVFFFHNDLFCVCKCLEGGTEGEYVSKCSREVKNFDFLRT